MTLSTTSFTLEWIQPIFSLPVQEYSVVVAGAIYTVVITTRSVRVKVSHLERGSDYTVTVFAVYNYSDNKFEARNIRVSAAPLDLITLSRGDYSVHAWTTSQHSNCWLLKLKKKNEWVWPSCWPSYPQAHHSFITNSEVFSHERN